MAGQSTAAPQHSSATGRVIIVVQEEGTRTRIGGAGVRVMTPGLVVDVEGVTGADGTFHADVPAGNYEVGVWAANYRAAHDPVRDGMWSPLPRRTRDNALVYKTTLVNVAVRAGERRSLAFELSPAAPAPPIAAPRATTGSISGRVVPASYPVEVLLQNLDDRGHGIYWKSCRSIAAARLRLAPARAHDMGFEQRQASKWQRRSSTSMQRR